MRNTGLRPALHLQHTRLPRCNQEGTTGLKQWLFIPYIALCHSLHAGVQCLPSTSPSHPSVHLLTPPTTLTLCCGLCVCVFVCVSLCPCACGDLVLCVRVPRLPCLSLQLVMAPHQHQGEAAVASSAPVRMTCTSRMTSTTRCRASGWWALMRASSHSHHSRWAGQGFIWQGVRKHPSLCQGEFVVEWMEPE